MGIYFHIPFCKQACYYCDFHFSTDNSIMVEMVECMLAEITLQNSYLASDLKTIYFGGGTPSLCSPKEIEKILNAVYSNYNVDEQAEITIECNPDDLNDSYLNELKLLGINRLSIGIQSFDDKELRLMNRAHDRSQALISLQLAREAGFNNISVDLIFGIPGGSLNMIRNNLNKLIEIRPEHISTYGMTIEPRTVFGNWVKKGKLVEEGEDQSAIQYEVIMATLKDHGYEHYEISNFALPGYESRHNSNYWKGATYLGIGPGAHSYNGESRQFNIRNNRKYIASIRKGIIPMEREVLSRSQKINETIMTSIRTKWGCDLVSLKTKFDYDLYSIHKKYLEQILAEDYIIVSEGMLVLTYKGKLIADHITEKLFHED